MDDAQPQPDKTTPLDPPALHTIVVGDQPTSWAAAGFALSGPALDEVVIGPIRIKLVGGEQRGFVAWEFANLEHDGSIDGLLSRRRDEHGRPAHEHPNGVATLDHVVVMSPDVDRTVASLVASGFEPRRRRIIEDATPPRQQVFFWIGPTILELVGPLEPTSAKPATIWGLAVVSDDIDRSKQELGDRLSDPKAAVQPGRRIATLRTRDLDISLTVAFMSPHH